MSKIKDIGKGEWKRNRLIELGREGLPLKAIAERLGISPDKAREVWKEEMGITYREWLQNRKEKE